MNMKMVFEEELRPAINVCGEFNLRILVHTTNIDKNGRYLTEMKDGNLSYSNPEFIIFLDSERRFNEFSWDTSGSYAEQIKPKPTFETIKEINDWFKSNEQQNVSFKWQLGMKMLDEVKYHSLEGEELDEYVRSVFNKTLNGRSFYRASNSNDNNPLDIVEWIVEDVILEDIENLPFFQHFVEVKANTYGGVVEWYSDKDSVLSTSAFAGNHYDVNCINIKEEYYTIQREWVYFDIFKDIELFLSGDVSLESIKGKIHNKVYEYVSDRMCFDFQNLLECFNDHESQHLGIVSFKNDGESLESLCNKVKEYNQCDKLIIAGSRTALQKLAAIILEESICYVNETIAEWNGNKIMLIPTWDMKDVLFVLGDAENRKPIKFEFVGDTRTKLGGSDWLSDSISDFIAQTCLSAAVLVSNGYGVFTFDK